MCVRIKEKDNDNDDDEMEKKTCVETVSNLHNGNLLQIHSNDSFEYSNVMTYSIELNADDNDDDDSFGIEQSGFFLGGTEFLRQTVRRLTK